MTGGPIAPLWLVLPLAGIALIIQAGYLIALGELPKGKIPPSRKRIRKASGWLSMFAIPLTAYGFGFASNQDPKLFAMVWMVAIGLIAIVFMLAVLDTINTMRLQRVAQQKLDVEYRAALALSVQRSKQGSSPDLKLVHDEPDEPDEPDEHGEPNEADNA